ncbi:MAG: DUF86 domain-containing protein [Kamptonema sp. SIO4C4]|nr:DUF86 domain-containing protein [Kamptonema sp. SIO4C4]
MLSPVDPKKDLENNRILTLAVVKDLEIIGEAAGRITDDCRARHPQLPWLDITGMRNRLIHAYFDVNLDVVWDTITNDLTPLIKTLNRVIQQGKLKRTKPTILLITV